MTGGSIFLIIMMIVLVVVIVVYVYKSISKPKQLKSIEKEINIRYYTKAIKSLRALLKKEPNHYQARLLLGSALNKSGEVQASIDEYRSTSFLLFISSFKLIWSPINQTAQSLKGWPVLRQRSRETNSYLRSDISQPVPTKSLKMWERPSNSGRSSTLWMAPLKTSAPSYSSLAIFVLPIA